MMSTLKSLLNIYNEALQLAYVGYKYPSLREKHIEFNSQIDANAIYEARIFRKTVLKMHNYPKQITSRPLLRKQDFKIKNGKVSIIYKPKNRIVCDIFPSEKQLALINEANSKGARLVEKDDEFYLNLTLEKEVEWEECETIIGVDIGINYIAVCSALDKNGKTSNPLFFKGGEWKHLCDRKRKIISSKEFEHITRKQHEILHIVSKRIVEYAKRFPKPIIVLEKLGKFKNNSKNKRWNFLLGNWARRKLQFMIEYKAKWEGIPVVFVYPAYTSLYCHYCGAKGVRNGIIFKCSNCKREYNADANAAMNLAKKFRQLLNEPKAVTEECSSRDLSSLGEGETCLPRQTQLQPENGRQMNRVMVTRTVSLPLALGGD